MCFSWEYRTIGINIKNSPKANISNDSKKIPNMSKEFLEKEFNQYYSNEKNDNIALQCQALINIYGKRGWEHYFQGQIGNLILFYFKRKLGIKESYTVAKLSPEEEALIQSLDQSQKP
tara:strand:- start:2266 stop:2619 length:354 start_codon:yes stop_codon:yes gene_type:complete